MPVCPGCQTESAPGAKFWQECAAPLAARCASGGAPLPPAAKFCPECAHSTSAPAASTPRFASPEAYTLTPRLVVADLQARTQDAALRAGLESVPLIRELADLARGSDGP
jgi:hypothetical protein